ncbi:MAG: hypothetical protein AAF638_07260 [Pseudomonadota bacterium]
MTEESFVSNANETAGAPRAPDHRMVFSDFAGRLAALLHQRQKEGMGAMVQPPRIQSLS